MAIRITPSTTLNSIRFSTEANVDGNYNQSSIDVTIAAGQGYYQIGKDTSDPYDAANDVIEFYRNSGAYICGGRADAFANPVGTAYTDINGILSDLETFFFDLSGGFTEAAGPGVLYVSPLGDDSNPGTIQSPRLTINTALVDVAAGGEVVCLPGLYGDYITAVNGKTLRLEPGANFAYTMSGNRHWFSDLGGNVQFSIIGSKGTNTVSVTAATPQTIGNAINVSGNSNINIRGLQVTVSSGNIQGPLMLVGSASPNVTIEECYLLNSSGTSHAVSLTGTASGSQIRFNESALHNSNSIATMRIAGNHIPRLRNVLFYKVFGTLCMDAPSGTQNVDIYSAFANKNYDIPNIALKVNANGFIFNSAVRP
jgi:hypothetical protein